MVLFTASGFPTAESDRYTGRELWKRQLYKNVQTIDKTTQNTKHKTLQNRIILKT
jgi:hypothetical protein